MPAGPRRGAADARAGRRPALVAMAIGLGLSVPGANPAAAGASTPDVGSACRGQVYLTLDTGNMSQAERIAAILKAADVRATFFLANERTPRGDFALDDSWRAFWRARVAEGHAFGSHTYDHVYFRPKPAAAAAGTKGPGAVGGQAWATPQFGDQAGRRLSWGAAEVCAEIRRVDDRFQALTGRRLDPLWRAPGGKAPAVVMDAARSCGYRHVFWAPAGFLGDELPSDRHPNAALLEQALRTIRAGDILMAHLGIWSREDPYAPMLAPLIEGLKQRGLCFATLREFPARADPAQGRAS